jgi:hypothetical protein
MLHDEAPRVERQKSAEAEAEAEAEVHVATSGHRTWDMGEGIPRPKIIAYI